MNAAVDAQELTALELHPEDPLLSFQAWYARACDAVAQPEAMGLATVGPDGRPALRMVLYKGLSGGGLRFFTNHDSRKARELAANPAAALLFYWQPLRRQVRVEGRVERLSAEESDAYFAGRDPESRLGAWASAQSAPLPQRATLEARVEAERRRFAGREIPRPPFWGGYRLLPTYLEFWQGRDNRLHDRFAYTLAGEGWRLERLYP